MSSSDTYPPFAVGQLYVFPFNYLGKVLDASKKITLHWLDDVYIGGQVPHVLKMNLNHVIERAHLVSYD